MTTRRIPAPMLFGLNAPARWLRTLAALTDDAASGTQLATASACRRHWQHGSAPAVKRAHLVRGRA